jgi:hypothetical protein
MSALFGARLEPRNERRVALGTIAQPPQVSSTCVSVTPNSGRDFHLQGPAVPGARPNPHSGETGTSSASVHAPSLRAVVYPPASGRSAQPAVRRGPFGQSQGAVQASRRGAKKDQPKSCSNCRFLAWRKELGTIHPKDIVGDPLKGHKCPKLPLCYSDSLKDERSPYHQDARSFRELMKNSDKEVCIAEGKGVQQKLAFQR